MTDNPSNALTHYLDSIELNLKKTGVAAALEIVAYPDGHAAIGTHPLNGRDELLTAVRYLFDRACRDAEAHAAARGDDRERTQRVTEADLRAGRIRIPRGSMHLFPGERGEIEVDLRGTRLRCRYDPRLGPDQERSGVLLVGKRPLADAVTANETLAIIVSGGVVRLE